MKKIVGAFLALFVFIQCQIGWADTQADHNVLRQLRQTAAEALNSNDFEKLTPLLDKNFTIMTVDNHKFSNLQDFKTYWDKLFAGDKAILKSIQVDPTADALTEFVTPDIGIVYGTSMDTYHFTDGDSRKMETRWSAVVKRNPEGWKLVSIHFSGNILDNPVLTAAKARAYWFGGLGILLGLILGVLISWCCRCRKAKP